MRVVSLLQPAATLTVTRQPWREEERLAAGADIDSQAPTVQRWVTFDFACPPGVVGTRIAIHATKTPPKGGGIRRVGDWWFYVGRDGAWTHHDDDPESHGPSFLPGNTTNLPLGVVVGSAKVEASYPIVDVLDPDDDDRTVIFRNDDTLWLWPAGTGVDARTDISDQLPYCDWSPGRFAWLLTDAAPCQERCPWCWSEWPERLGYVRPGSGDCRVCDGERRCDPVSWVSSGGRLPEWQAT